MWGAAPQMRVRWVLLQAVYAVWRGRMISNLLLPVLIMLFMCILGAKLVQQASEEACVT